MTGKLPNILLIVTDCGRSDRWVGPGRSAQTPNVDRLAQEGIAFPNTITEKSCTTPSFATLLTGLYSTRHGVHLVWGYRLSDRIPLVTHALAAEGYHCYAEMTGPLLPEMGLDRAFETYNYRAPCDYLHTEWGDLFLGRLRTGFYREPWFMVLHLWELHPRRQVQADFGNDRYGRTEYDRSVSSLDAQLGRVFAAVPDNTLIAFTGDHGEKLDTETYREGTAVDYARRLLRVDQAEGMVPFSVARWAGPSVLQQFYEHCIPLMRNVRLRGDGGAPAYGRWERLKDRVRLLRLTPMVFVHDLLKLRAPVKLTNVMKRRGLLDEARAKAKVDRFVRSVGNDRLLDMHMRMWASSYRQNIEEGHIISLYDFVVRVPLIIRPPAGAPRGRSWNRMVRQPDILPTIVDLVGIDPEKLGDIDGRSFRPLVEGRPWECLPAYLSLTGLPEDLELRGVRTERHKYTYGPRNPEMPEELYDLQNDPGETVNLASRQSATCSELRRLSESLLPAGGQAPAEMLEITADQQQSIERHLQELGYIE